MLKSIYKKIKNLSLAEKLFTFIIIPIIIGWIVTYTYGLIFPGVDTEILASQRAIQSDISTMKIKLELYEKKYPKINRNNINKAERDSARDEIIFAIRNTHELTDSEKNEIITMLENNDIDSAIKSISLKSPINISVLEVAYVNGRWSKTIDINPGDEILFQVHVYANGGDLYNVKIYPPQLDNIIFSDTKFVNASVLSNEIKLITDTVSVNTNETVQLKYVKAALFLDSNKKPFWSINKAKIFPIYNAGDLSLDHFINLVVKYKAVAVDE